MKKVEKLRKWMAANDYDGIILGRRDNYTWISGGAKNHVCLLYTSPSPRD